MNRITFNYSLKTLLDLFIFVLQGAFTFVSMISLYMLLALLDYRGGFDSFIGLAIVQPLIGTVLSISTIVCCLFVGLPLRMIKRLHHWWTQHFYISFILLGIGMALFLASLPPLFMEQQTFMIEEETITKLQPNLLLVSIGWVTTAFALLHTFPPNSLKMKVYNLLKALTGQAGKDVLH